MNVSPLCECKFELSSPPVEGHHTVCGMKADWVVINKTKGRIYSACSLCVGKLESGCTYSIFPARDYSLHANGHDLRADHSKSCQEEK